MRMQLDLRERTGGGTTMTIASRFASVGDLEQILERGFAEGITLAVNQIEAILAG